MRNRLYCYIVSIFIILSCISSALSENMTPNEALQIIKEYQMEFDKYSSQELLDIACDEQHPAYSHLYFGYADENAKCDEYNVHLLSKDGSPLALECTSEDYNEPIYADFFIQGYNDYAIPCFIIYGNDIYKKTVNKISLHSGNADYLIEYKDKEYSYIENEMFYAVCISMFEMQIDLLTQMAENNALEIEITFKGGKKIQAVYNAISNGQENGAYICLQALKEAHYIDENGQMQTDFADFYFSSILQSAKKHMSVTDKNDKKNKGFQLFSEKYGLTITSNGDNGVTNSSQPWFIINVKNESKKTVDGFDLVYYGTNVYGDIIEVDGSGAKLIYYTVVKDVKAGKSRSTEKIYFYNSTQKPKVIYIAIRRIHFNDGTLIEIPLRDLCFYYSKITY